MSLVPTNGSTTLTNAYNTIWRYNEEAILSIEIVQPQSLYIVVPEAALKKGVNIPLGFYVSQVFIAPADNSVGFTRRASSIITGVLNEEIKNYLKSNSSAKLIPISTDLAIYDPITGLHEKLKVANIQLISETKSTAPAATSP